MRQRIGRRRLRKQRPALALGQPPKGYGAAKAKLQAQGHVFERARSEPGSRKVSCAPVVIPSLRRDDGTFMLC